MAFETFDLGRIIQQAEAIKGMRRQGEEDILRKRYLEVQTKNASDAGQRANTEAQAKLDATTARQHFITADYVEKSQDPVRTAKEFIPDLVKAFESSNGAGSFDQLPPDTVKRMVSDAKARAAAAAGINLGPTPEQQAEHDFRMSQIGAQGAVGLANVNAQGHNAMQLEQTRSANDLREIAARGEQDRNTASVTSPAKANAEAQKLRKEFEGLASVSNYRAVEPLLKSAANAPDTGYGDLDIIYAVGKILDPGSVVREGELKLTIDAGSPLQKVLGATRFNFEKGGRLTPQQRTQVMQMLNGRAGAIKESYDRERQRFAGYAQQSNLDPSMVVGGEEAPAAAPAAPAGGAQFNYVPGQGLVPAQ